jgi:hypothetical protein
MGPISHPKAFLLLSLISSRHPICKLTVRFQGYPLVKKVTPVIKLLPKRHCSSEFRSVDAELFSADI